MQMNESLTDVGLLTQMTEQGFTFYNQLNDWLAKEKQNAFDFKTTRDLEKSELIKSMGGAPTPPPSGGMPNIQAPQGYGGAAAMGGQQWGQPAMQMGQYG